MEQIEITYNRSVPETVVINVPCYRKKETSSVFYFVYGTRERQCIRVDAYEGLDMQSIEEVGYSLAFDNTIECSEEEFKAAYEKVANRLDQLVHGYTGHEQKFRDQHIIDSMDELIGLKTDKPYAELIDNSIPVDAQEIKLDVIVMKKIKLIKLSDCDNPLYPNHILPGFEKVGFMFERPKVGQSFWIGDWGTSTVTSIIDDNTFITRNSIYKIEEINND